MRYFFNVAGAIYDPDVVGHEIATLGEARTTAVRFASEMLRDHPTVVWEGDDFRVEVTDDEQLLLFTVIVLGIDAPVLATPARPLTSVD